MTPASGRATLIAAILAAAAGGLLLMIYFVALTGLRDLTCHLVGRDFVNLYLAGDLLDAGRGAVLFDGAAYLAELRAWLGPDYPVHNWSYPPLIFPLAEALALLPYPAALLAWYGTGALALAAALRLAGLPAFWMPLVLLSPAAVLNILAGQNGFFIAALILAALFWAERGKPLRAGLAWALVAVKAHLGLAVLPMLIGQGRARVIAAGAAFLGLAVALTLLRYGTDPWAGFLGETAPAQRRVIEAWQGLFQYLMPTLFMQARLLGADIATAYAIHALGAAIAVLLLARAWPGRRGDTRDWLTWLCLATFLLLPYSFLYDMVILQAALALWHREPEALFALRDAALARMLWIALWALPYLALAAAVLAALQPAPFLLFFLLWRRAAARRLSPPG